MSEIRQVGPNHWVEPEDCGFTPNFHITQHGVEHYLMVIVLIVSVGDLKLSTGK